MRSGGSASSPWPAVFQPSRSPVKYGLPAKSVASVQVVGSPPPLLSSEPPSDEPPSEPLESTEPLSAGPLSSGSIVVGASSPPVDSTAPSSELSSSSSGPGRTQPNIGKARSRQGEIQ